MPEPGNGVQRWTPQEFALFWTVSLDFTSKSPLFAAVAAFVVYVQTLFFLLKRQNQHKNQCLEACSTDPKPAVCLLHFDFLIQICTCMFITLLSGQEGWPSVCNLATGEWCRCS